MRHIVTGSVVALLATAYVAAVQPPPTAAKPAADIGTTYSVRYPSGNIVTVNWHADESTSTQKLLGANIVAFGGTIPKPPPTGTFAQNVEAAYQAVAGDEATKRKFAGYFGQVYSEVGKIVTAGGFGTPITDTSRADEMLTKAYTAVAGQAGAANWSSFKGAIRDLLNDKGGDAKVIGGLLSEIGAVLKTHAAQTAAASGEQFAIQTAMDAITKNLTPGDIELWIRLFELLLPLLIQLFGLFG